MERSWFNTKETSEYLGVAKATLDSMRTRGGGPTFKKFGRLVRYEKAALDAWIDSRPTGSTTTEIQNQAIGGA